MVISLGSDPRSMAGRPSNQSDMLGQVFTPSDIAAQMAEELLRDRHNSGLIILDPAVGPATFPISLHATGMLHSSDKMILRDIDNKMIAKTRREMTKVGRDTDVRCSDYLEENVPKCDLVIMNPPYVRQEWIDKKNSYQKILQNRYGVDVPGTSNLYVYFIVKALADLKPGGKLICIVYDSWLFTKFGRWLAGILKANCDSIETTNVGQQPFHGRLIDATIIKAIRKSEDFRSKPEENAATGMMKQSPLSRVEGASPVHTLFHTKRGLRLKQTGFFMIDLKEGHKVGATPFVKKIGRLRGYVVPDDHPEAALLQYIDSATDDRLVSEIDRRLSKAQENPEKNVAILTWHKERPDSWFFHRKAPFAPILFNYYLRGRPRHIYNPDRAFADNFYGLTPLASVDPVIPFAIMNSTCVCLEILHRARNQGNGLRKIQLFEYRDVMVLDWNCLDNKAQKRLCKLGKELLGPSNNVPLTIRKIDEVVAYEFDSRQLSPLQLDVKLQNYNNHIKKGKRS